MVFWRSKICNTTNCLKSLRQSLRRRYNAELHFIAVRLLGLFTECIAGAEFNIRE